MIKLKGFWKVSKRSKLNDEMRRWLYDILGFRASLGSLSEAMPAMIKSQKNRGKKGEKKAEILDRIHVESERSGESFSDSLKKFIPEDEFHLIASAERNGQLSIGLKKANERLEIKIKHRLEIQGVLQSLVGRFLMMVGIIWFLGKTLFPPLEKIQPIENWHPLASTMYELSTSIHYWFPSLVLSIAIVSYFVRWSLSNWETGKYRNWAMEHLQPWNLHREITAMTIIDSFGAMVGNRSEKQALAILKHSTNNKWLKQCISRMSDRIRTGEGNPMLNNSLLASDLSDVLAAMGGGGNKQEFYNQAVHRLEGRVNKRIESLKKRIETIGTLLLYTVMGCMVMSYFLVSLSTF